MAPRKPNPMEEERPVASSDDEETEEEETSSEEEDDDEETPEPTHLSSPPPKQVAPKKPEPSAPAATPQSKSSSSEEESGSGSDSESEHEQAPKPVATKPMEETPKTTKPRSKLASKRTNETEGMQKDAKRAKNGADGDGDEEASESKKPGEDMKKSLFQRLWSEDDEIAVLEGMIEFSTQNGIDPNQDMNAFHEFINKSLQGDVSRKKLVDKIRRLKKKYENNVEKGIKNGEDRTFSRLHEQKAFNLSKKVWGGEGCSGVVESAVKSNRKTRKSQNQRGNSKQLAALKAEMLNGPKKLEKMEVDNNKESSLKTVDVEKFLPDNSFGVAGLEDYVIKNGLDMIGGSKKAELEQRWKKLHNAQLELYIERIELVNE